MYELGARELRAGELGAGELGAKELGAGKLGTRNPYIWVSTRIGVGSSNSRKSSSRNLHQESFPLGNIPPLIPLTGLI